MSTIINEQQETSDAVSLPPQRIVIIGCGYVGGAIARYWHPQPDKTVAVTTTRSDRVAELEAIASEVVVMRGDDAEAVNSVVKNRDAVVLSVAPISDRLVEPEVYAQTYIPTAKNLVAALQENSHPKQLIYLSSCGVYGDKKGERVDENSPVNPASAYSEVLYKTEEILWQSVRENVRLCILRLGGIYGPGRTMEKRMSRLAGKTLSGSGDNINNWIHLEDVVGAVEFVRKNQSRGLYNVVNDVKQTTREMCDEICDRLGLDPVFWDPEKESDRPNSSRVSNQKIKAAGYQLIYPDRLI